MIDRVFCVIHHLYVRFLQNVFCSLLLSSSVLQTASMSTRTFKKFLSFILTVWNLHALGSMCIAFYKNLLFTDHCLLKHLHPFYLILLIKRYTLRYHGSTFPRFHSSNTIQGRSRVYRVVTYGGFLKHLNAEYYLNERCYMFICY